MNWLLLFFGVQIQIRQFNDTFLALIEGILGTSHEIPNQALVKVPTAVHIAYHKSVFGLNKVQFRPTSALFL